LIAPVSQLPPYIHQHIKIIDNRWIQSKYFAPISACLDFASEQNIFVTQLVGSVICPRNKSVRNLTLDEYTQAT